MHKIKWVQNRKKNQGFSLLTVIVSVAFIGIMAMLVLYMALANFNMKVTDLKGKDSFYTAEQALEEIRTGLQEDVGNAMSIAYTKVLETYSKDADVTKELSNGANAQIYFDLLANDTKKPGIYIIDQPEDDVSQPSIKKKLLANFKTLSNNRQILLITHNPQFIVNLDVDNIIFLKKDDNTGKISVENGALEYKDDKTDILKIVADNIEGGIDSLKERYKKYEKNN